MADLFEMTPGQRLGSIPGLTWNRHNAATRWVERHVAPAPPVSSANHDGDSLAVRAVNTTGGDLKKGHVVELAGSGVDWKGVRDAWVSERGKDGTDAAAIADQEVFGNDPYLNAVDPTSASPDLWGVVVSGGAEDSRVDVAVRGLVAVRVNVTDTSHGYVRPLSGNTTQLASTGSDTGARLLYRAWEAEDVADEEDPTEREGVQWCLVMLSGASGGGGEVSVDISLSLVRLTGSVDPRVNGRCGFGPRVGFGRDGTLCQVCLPHLVGEVVEVAGLKFDFTDASEGDIVEGESNDGGLTLPYVDVYNTSASRMKRLSHPNSLYWYVKLTTVTSGSFNTFYGELISPTELRTLEGFVEDSNDTQHIVNDEDGLEWRDVPDAGTCEDVQVVTNVQCVEGEIVVTTTDVCSYQPVV